MDQVNKTNKVISVNDKENHKNTNHYKRIVTRWKNCTLVGNLTYTVE